MAYTPFQPVQMGGFVRNISVSRSNVAQNTKGRAVLIDPNPRAVYLAYDNAHKCAVLTDMDSAIEYKLNPRTYYIFLLARLNTDMKGTQVGDEIVVEYLRLSDTVYADFVDAYNEMETVSTLILKPVVKKGNNGQDFSYITPVPSPTPATEAVYQKLENLDVEALWNLVLLDLGKTVDEYAKLLASEPVSDSEARAIEARSQSPRPAIAPRTPQPQRPAQKQPVRRDLKNEPRQVVDTTAEELPEDDPFQNESFEEPDDFQ